MEEFDIDIVHHPRRRHDNVDGLTRAYKGVGDVLWDDNFLDAAIMAINAEEALEEYREIIQYLNGMRFLIRATKAIRTKITHKSQNYSMIAISSTSKGRMVFYDEPLENVTPHVFCMSFMMGSVEATLRDEYNRKDFASMLVLAHLL